MIEDAYAYRIVKDYKHWTVYLHEDQGFIGRCVIWAKREDAEDLALATPAEEKELFEILRSVRKATTELFGADWFNYSFLGNQDRHLHCHFFPRYQKPVEFSGVTFTDLDFNKQPSKTGTTNFVSKEMLIAIRDTLAVKL
jgi:diadenosine tetraphosphate (Ap4A) HIT family hydrolase